MTTPTPPTNDPFLPPSELTDPQGQAVPAKPDTGWVKSVEAKPDTFAMRPDAGTFEPPSTGGVSTPTGPTPEYRPSGTSRAVPRINPANLETTVLTPVAAPTDILHRIPISERKLWRLLAGGAAGLALLSIAFSLYLWSANAKWQERADQLTSEAYNLGAKLAVEQSHVLDQQADIDAITQQLETARDRLVELADETTQAGDSAAFAQQQIAKYEELAALGGSVSLALNRCVNEQKNLVTYLKNPSLYSEEDVANFEATVKALCAAAQSANTGLQQALTE